ncbi:DUF1761 domain-containing protein [Arsenicibacter rosenii]|uniref:DUF1761 domain-containing protein n=1 Tax=Arsenicibacter rosenii TaxID=1750698 RepID=A0A1S2VLL5_9BACT|nr:DUF1761 domain-containing protein [Arsenicibacter rosenii]OIN59300.1 hypothetical protein BLX24_09955 [Arsenicibacter rosenii]
MNITVALQHLNWPAVFAAAFSTFLIGGLWYSPVLFQKSWIRANGFDPANLPKSNPAVVFGLAFFFAFVMALNLALFIGQADVSFGATAGFMTGFGWVALAVAIIALFESRPLAYILINGGYMVVTFTVMGTIIGAWH